MTTAGMTAARGLLSGLYHAGHRRKKNVFTFFLFLSRFYVFNVFLFSKRFLKKRWQSSERQAD